MSIVCPNHGESRTVTAGLHSTCLILSFLTGGKTEAESDAVAGNAKQSIYADHTRTDPHSVTGCYKKLLLLFLHRASSRQITEVQNQANARVAQLQTQIDLLTARPPSSTATVSAHKRSLPGARPMTPRSTATNVAPKEPPRWPAPITPRPTLLRPTFGTPRTAPPKVTLALPPPLRCSLLH
nr:unnamed protein product [Spirometra erinaceieuropaei]